MLIEQVRDLIAQLGYALRAVRGAIAILDDAETLNMPAQNALLKTLEEPPGYAIIFLVTQSERALLDTVRSRLRPVRFGPLAVADLEAYSRPREARPGPRAGDRAAGARQRRPRARADRRATSRRSQS